MSEFVVGKYLDTMLFSFFKDIAWTKVNIDKVADTGLSQQDYAGLFFSSQNVMKRRSAMMRGVTLPLVCLWRTSLPKVKPGFYGHSVMPRHFQTTNYQGETFYYRGRLVTYEVEYHLYAESYFLEYTSRFMDDMTVIDFLRYFPITLTGYLDDYTTRVELELVGSTKRDAVDEDNEHRSFLIDTTWKLSVTIPDIRVGAFLERLNLYLNDTYVRSFPEVL